jgi:cytochrome c
LNSLIGRSAGTTEFKYSNAIKKSGITWTDKHLFMFLKAPAKYVPGLKMAFAGLESEADRANLIAYLGTM